MSRYEGGRWDIWEGLRRMVPVTEKKEMRVPRTK
jgi:hypothetical protein